MRANGINTATQRRWLAAGMALLLPALLSACVWSNHRRSYGYNSALYPNPGYADQNAEANGQAEAVPATPAVPGKSVQRIPITFDQGIRAAYMLLDAGNHAGAIEAFQEAIYTDPTRADGWYHLACGYSRWSWADDPGRDYQGDRPAPEHLRRAAMMALDQAVARGWSDLAHMSQDPDMGPLRNLPEYRAVCMLIHRNLGHQAYIGITGSSADDRTGFLIDSVGQGSSATRPYVGPVSRNDPDADGVLLPGDLIVAIDLAPVRDLQTLAAALGQKSPGDACSVTVRRNDQFVVVPLLLGARPAATTDRLMPTRAPRVTDLPEITVVEDGPGVVVVNRGRRHGLEPGTVLTVTRTDKVVAQVEIDDVYDERAKGHILHADVIDSNVTAGDAVRPALPPDRRLIDEWIRAQRPDPQPEPVAPAVPYPVPTPAPAPAVDQPTPTPTPAPQVAPDDAVTATPAPAPTPPAEVEKPKPTRKVTGADIVAMQKAGLSDTTIISVIRASSVQVDDSDVQPMLEELARAGASAAVLDALCEQLAQSRR